MTPTRDSNMPVTSCTLAPPCPYRRYTGSAHGPPSGDTAQSAAMQSSQKEHLYKILVIGDLGVGKTSIIKRYVHQTYSTNYRATIGVDFALKVLNWDSETVRLQLWDIAGRRVRKSSPCSCLWSRALSELSKRYDAVHVFKRVQL